MIINQYDQSLAVTCSFSIEFIKNTHNENIILNKQMYNDKKINKYKLYIQTYHNEKCLHFYKSN